MLSKPLSTLSIVGKADTERPLNPAALFRFCRSRHLESAVCNRDVVPLSESKRDRAEIGFAPVRLRRSSKAVHRFCGYAACGMTAAMPNPELCRIPPQ